MEEKQINQKLEKKKNIDNLIQNVRKESEFSEKRAKQARNSSQDVLPITNKTEAIVTGRNLSISTKQAVAVCNFIRNKEADKAIGDLEKVSKMKIAVPMKGEIPHRKGKIMSGRYPIKAVMEFIKLVKSLKANAILNELELEKFKIFCMANQASRPYKRFGQGRMKRSNIVIKLIPISNREESKE